MGAACVFTLDTQIRKHGIKLQAGRICSSLLSQMETTSNACIFFQLRRAAWKEALRKRKANRMHVRCLGPVSSGFGTGPEHDQLLRVP